MSDLFKSIETFMQKNGLVDALKVFRAQSKRSSNITPKSAYVSLTTIGKTIIPSDQQSQNKLREHLQKADNKYLKRFVDRAKKGVNISGQQNLASRITEQPFFKKLVQKQVNLYEQYKQNVLLSMNNPSSILDESKVYQNQWEGQNDIGYEIIEFPEHEFSRVLREVQSLKHYQKNAIKQVPFPEAYFTLWERSRTTSSFNQQDKMLTKLPPNVLFESPKKPNQNDVYPLQSEGVVFGSCDLKVIYDRQKTGFQEEKVMKIVINQVLAGRFQIVNLLGQAQFSRAIQVKDLTSPNQKSKYCIKMIHNDKDYLDQALDQIKLLRYIKANCNPDDACLINMHDFFYHREHLMILTELLKENLYDAYRQQPEYFSLSRIQVITKQILVAIATMHRLHIIHNDLKPQNILVKSYSNSLIKVIDIGSSVFFHDQLQFYVQTRSYRAPQIILGCPYTQKIDVWSLGCIVAQLFTRQVLFQSDNVVGILARIQGLRGPWPSWMLEKGKEVSKYFTKQLILFQQIKEQVGEQGKKKKHKTGLNRIYMPKLTNLKSRIKSNNRNFLDFLSKCLKIDPSVRISAKQALNHPFITEPIVEQ